ncbi:MAG TPA: hypothetical protein VK995_03480, partial [Oceanipulchritudo sp.]|nr:hypothetical protein [Oceanipulchritudo sp.]
WPGDILGITGRSGLEIGDTLTEDHSIVYDAIPQFAPECFIRLKHTDTQHFKRFRKGLEQLLQEKVVQQFFPVNSESRVPVLGAVGPLQFDVVRFRLQSEYGADTAEERLPWCVTRWVDPAVEEEALTAKNLYGTAVARDDFGRLCILFESAWNLEYFTRHNQGIKLYSTPPTAANENPRPVLIDN